MVSRSLLALGLALSLAACATTAPQTGATQFAEAHQYYLAGDYQQAFPLALAAARQGNASAQYAVGYMYYSGQGVDQNIDRALEWLKASAQQGNPSAVEALSRLAARPTAPAEVQAPR